MQTDFENIKTEKHNGLLTSAKKNKNNVHC